MPTRKRTVEEPDAAVEVAQVETVRLVPVPGAYIPDEPAEEREVSLEEAERLLAFQPPAFMVAPPSEPTADVVEEPQE